MNNAKLLVKGSAIRTIEFAISILVGFFLMPFIIHSLGDEDYGLWIFISSFIGYYGLLEFGLDTAVKKYLSKYIGSKNIQEINRTFNTSIFIFSIIGILVIIIAIITSLIVPLLIDNITKVNTFRWIIFILGLNLALGFPTTVIGAFFAANLRYDISIIISIIKTIFRTFLIIFSLKTGYGIMALTWITFLLGVMSYIAKYIILKRNYKYIHISRKFIDKNKIRQLLSYSIYNFIGRLADQIKFNVDYLVITIFLGLADVTMFSIGARLITYFRQFIYASIGILLPVFSQYEGRKDFDTLIKQFIFTTKISAYISILIASFFLIYGFTFIEIWVGERYLASYSILVILGISIVLDLMQNPSVQLLYSMSKHKFYAITNVLEGLINIVLSIFLVREYGIVGIAIGTAIPIAIHKIIVQPIYVCKVIEIKIFDYYILIIVPIILKAIAIILPFYFAIKAFIFPNFFNLVSLSLIQAFIYFPIIYYIGFNPDERIIFKRVFKKQVNPA